MIDYTPGPWKADGSQIYAVESQILSKRVGEVSTHRDNYEGNARLIAAAPDMAGALVDVIHAHQRGDAQEVDAIADILITAGVIEDTR